jgi:subtilisin family serine protease/TolB-like protein
MPKPVIALICVLVLIAAGVSGWYFTMGPGAKPVAESTDDGPLPSLTAPGGDERYIPPAGEVTEDYIREDVELTPIDPPENLDTESTNPADPPLIRNVSADGEDDLPLIDADAPDAGEHGGADTPKPTGQNKDASAKPGLAVIPFQLKGTINEEEAGSILSELLLAEIDSKAYQLFERSQIQSLLKEQKFQETDLVNDARVAAKFGRLAGIRYLVLGSLSRLGTTYHLTARVVDCEDGSIGERGSVKFNTIDAAPDKLPELVNLLSLRKGQVIDGDDETPGENDAPPKQVDLIDAENPDALFAVTVKTREGKDTFVEGETVSFEITADRDCFLTLLTRDSEGSVTLLLPNAWQRRAFVRKGQKIMIPSEDAGFTFPIQAPHGKTKLRVIASTKPIQLAGVDAQRMMKEKFVALPDGAKAIGVAGDPEAAAVGDGAGLAKFLKPEEWASASLIIATSRERVQEPKPEPEPVPPVQPEPTPPPSAKPPFAPVISGKDPNDKLIEVWQRIVKSNTGSIKSIGDGASTFRTGMMFPDAKADDEVSSLLVIKKQNPANTKNIDGVDASNYSTELVTIIAPNTKTVGGDGWALQVQAIQDADDSVIAVVPDLPVHAFRSLPNTEFFDAQWALKSQVNSGCDTVWHKVMRDLPAATEYPLIAVIDQGLDLEDPRLAAIAWQNPKEIKGNGIDDDKNGYVDDVHGYHISLEKPGLNDPNAPFNHGSYVSSIISCKSLGKSDDLIGIAPGAKILSLGALNWDAEKNTASGSTQAVLEALAYAADQGAKVINMSLGGFGDKTMAKLTPKQLSQYNAHPIWDRLEREGILVVIAAGNSDTDIDEYPATPASLSKMRSNIITVMAIDPAGLRARGYRKDAKDWKPYSNYGKQSVHIAAPGTAVLGISKPFDTSAYDGTSFAAPIVTGAAAVLWAKNPDWDYKQVKRAILESARPVKGLDNKCATGGMLDLEAALNWRPRN